MRQMRAFDRYVLRAPIALAKLSSAFRLSPYFFRDADRFGKARRNLYRGLIYMSEKIYEICLFEGDYKDYLIRNLLCQSKQTQILSDRDFLSLEGLATHLATLSNLNLLVVDISEFENLGHSKNHQQLRIALQHFYDCLETLAHRGTTCVIFVSFPFYRQIHETPFVPDCIQLHIHPSEVLYFWEVELMNPPERSGQKFLFRPFIEAPPVLPCQ